MASRERNRATKHTLRMILVVVAGIHFNASASDIPDAVEIEQITANWVCKWCPDSQVSEGNVTAGAGYVTNDSYKHGDYTGLDEKGVYLIGDVDYVYKDNNGKYVDVRGADLGLDSRNITIEGGNHGQIAGASNWNMTGSVSYSELPKLNQDTARTPYRGNSMQRLPAGWTTTGNNTQDMTQLASALQDVDIYTDRKTFAMELNYQQNVNLSYGLGFQRDTKEGFRTAGLPQGGFRSAILAIPVDYVTDQGEFTVNYAQRRWRTAISYQFSSFNNNKNYVRWDNAFQSLTDPDDINNRQVSLEPDNTMQRITLTGAMNFNSQTTGNILLAYGRLEQDDDFLPYTINGSILHQPSNLPADSLGLLPTRSLGGKINTYDAIIKLRSQLTERLELEAKYQHNEQDNETSRETYDYIILDSTQSSTARSSLPYSFRKAMLALTGHYKLPDHKLSLGVGQNMVDRTYQEVETTTENIIKASYRTSKLETMDFRIRGELSNRDGDEYQPVADIATENPLMRKFNLADRKRNQIGFSLNYFPEAPWQIALYIDASKDDYSDSEIGLLESIQKDYTVAFIYTLSKALVFNVDYTVTTIESTQAGSDSFSTPTWQAENDDRIDVIHLGITYDVIPDKFNVGFDYSYANSEGETRVSTDEALPDLTSDRHTILLHGDYRLDDKSVITAFYRYEEYDESDWAVDDVNPNTIQNVLSLGETSPSYNIGVIGLAIRYAF